MDEAWFVNLPLSGDVGQNQIGPIMVHYISSVVDEIYGPNSIKKVVDKILETKYPYTVEGVVRWCGVTVMTL